MGRTVDMMDFTAMIRCRVGLLSYNQDSISVEFKEIKKKNLGECGPDLR